MGKRFRGQVVAVDWKNIISGRDGKIEPGKGREQILAIYCQACRSHWCPVYLDNHRSGGENVRLKINKNLHGFISPQHPGMKATPSPKERYKHFTGGNEEIRLRFFKSPVVSLRRFSSCGR
jgi:hypothetical protein